MDEVTPEQVTEAQARLQARGGYDWLIASGQQFWSVAEVVEALAAVGLDVSHDTVTRWFKPLHDTKNYGGKIGLRASRRDLLVYFAEEHLGDAQSRQA